MIWNHLHMVYVIYIMDGAVKIPHVNKFADKIVEMYSHTHNHMDYGFHDKKTKYSIWN